MVNKDLGIVTAYAYAVSKGYTGTEEEFAALMADYAEVGERAEAAATAAAASATAASGSASDSAASASAAAGSAGTATTAAGNASQAAQNASQSATAAAGSATAAGQSATAAAGSATTAGDKATQAAQSATAAAGSATTAGASATAAQTAQTAAETAQTAAETAQAAAEAAAQTLVIDPTLTQPNQAAEAKATGDAIGLVKSHLEATQIVNEASGAIASFADGSDGVPVRGLTVQIEPIQSGTGDPSPDNVRPISGRQSVTVTRAGVNVWDEEWENGYINNIIGEFVASQNYICTKNFIPIVPGENYYIKTPVALKLIAYDANKTFLRAITSTWANEAIAGSTHLSDVYYIKFYNAASGALTTYNHDISINYPSTDHDYHPGTVASVEVQLGQTVYGGTVDVTTGEMVVNRAMVDLGTLEWRENEPFIYRTVISNILPAVTPPYENRQRGAVCSTYAPDNQYSVSSTAMTDKRWLRIEKEFFIRDTSYADVTAFKTAMNGVQLVYELAQPITIQLSSEQLTTVLGVNNVWSDADSVSVDYVADTKLYIEQLTEPDADMVADANITSGSYFMVGNALFLATANIANGSAIVPGTNCTRTNLAEALNALNT